MTSFAITTYQSLLIVRPGSSWSVEACLQDQVLESVAADPSDPGRLYVGTQGSGVWRSEDAGRTWEAAGGGVPHDHVTALALQRSEDSDLGVLYAGTEPSTLSRSGDGGETWRELPGLLELPSASSWSFPPKPDTHHVRWIEPDPHRPGKLYVAIEAGALVRTDDGGKTWRDRVSGGPIDTHQAATHPTEEGRVYSAAGDGYFESEDGGERWSNPMDGLQHRYLVGVGVDPADAGSVIVSAASGPYAAYNPGHAEAYLYRRTDGGPFKRVTEGMPAGRGTVASRLATHPEEAGVFYAANNHGLFRSEDAGMTWEALETFWPEGAFSRGVAALAVFTE